jgi:hypothetical protein
LFHPVVRSRSAGFVASLNDAGAGKALSDEIGAAPETRQILAVADGVEAHDPASVVPTSMSRTRRWIKAPPGSRNGVPQRMNGMWMATRSTSSPWL